jgi:hypothetical protein
MRLTGHLADLIAATQRRRSYHDGQVYDEYTFHHMVNVCTALAIARAIGLPRDQAVVLGISCCDVAR